MFSWIPTKHLLMKKMIKEQIQSLFLTSSEWNSAATLFSFFFPVLIYKDVS